jgi:hypothetical protein
MDFIRKLSESVYNSLYNNYYPIPIDTVIFTQNLRIKDEYESNDFLQGPVTYQTIGKYILYYMQKENCSKFLEFVLDDEDEYNNTIVLNIICERKE